jgi:hypothetical protein
VSFFYLLFANKYRFLLAKFQLDYILNKETPREAIKALDTLPTDMVEAYREVLNRIDKIKGNRIAFQVLSWLFYAQRHLKMNEIREAISVETNPPDSQLYPEYFLNPDQVIHCCQGLVELDKKSEIVWFTHYTVQEFLKDEVIGSGRPRQGVFNILGI